jgi:hypothetical protein
MHMRKFFLVSFVLSATLALAGTGFALEKTRVLDTQADEGWTSGSSCTIVYYNRCTLWSWAWSGFGDGGTFGVCADNCCTPERGIVTATTLRIFMAAPPGYNFTGTASLETVDANCCPTGVLASQPWLPTGAFGGLYDLHLWAQIVPAKFAVVYTVAGAANPMQVGTDHPAAGPTGPQACGFCYPLNRPNHSYAWGSAASPVCPGSTFNDGICDAQLRLDIYLTCQPVSVDASSWGSVKNLYR